MADLTSLYKNKPKRDFSIQACADCINKIAAQFPNEFKEGFFTDYFDIAGGTQPPKSKFISEPKVGYIKFLQIRDFSSDSTPTYIPISKNNKICSDNDLVLGRYGASVGKILTGKSGAYNVACAKIIFLDDKLIDRDFLFYWLHSTYFQNFLTSISRSAQGGFNKNDLNRISTKFPNLEIQIKLTTILKEIDFALLNGNKISFEKKGKTKIEIAFIEIVQKFLSFINEGEELSTELTHQLTLVKKLRQQLLQDAVQGKLVEQIKKEEPASELLKKIKKEKEKLIAEKNPSTSLRARKEKELPPIKPEEIPFEIPDNWVWCRLGEICDTITKGSSPNWQGVQYVDETKGILFITSKNVDSFKIDLTKATYVEETFNEIEPRSILKKGDLLTNIVGASIGRTALFDLDVIANINQAVCILRIEHNLINKDYLLNLMNSDLALKMMFESQFAPGRANLSMGNIASFTIPIPPLTEQIRIVQKLDELMQYCNELEASIKESESQNEKLLQQVLREALRPVSSTVSKR
jgi:type I restriction enzyme, S subunit